MAAMTDMDRYSRQIKLPQIASHGQQQLLDSRVLILGLGGLGSPAALYLAAAGVGELLLADDDVVDLSNLQRQIAHTEQRLGQSKVDSAARQLQQLNSTIAVQTYPQRLQEAELLALLPDVDVVLDCTDNFASRQLLNRCAHASRTPVVSAAAIRFDGQLSVFRHDLLGSPCYACLYGPPTANEGTDNCQDNGVLAPIVGVMGTMQALEAVKVLLELGEGLDGRLLLFDGLAGDWRTVKFTADPACVVCGS